MSTLVQTWLLTGIALAFTFMNGFNDSGSIVATVISSRALTPRYALFLSAVAHLAAPFLFGIAVADTIGHQVVAREAVTVPVVLAAASAAVLWCLITYRLGIPSSSSHALIGGLIGATAAGQGWRAILPSGLEKVFLALVLSPVLGMIGGYLLMWMAMYMAQRATPKVNIFFNRAQILALIALALSHGTNDAQKGMGLIVMGLMAVGSLREFSVPGWVVLACAFGISLGTAFGARRIIRTVGGKYYRVRPVHGFTAQCSSAIVILSAALLGGPVSSTEVISASIMGAGAAERISKVRWGVVREVVAAWVFTVPVTALVAALACRLFLLVF